MRVRGARSGFPPGSARRRPRVAEARPPKDGTGTGARRDRRRPRGGLRRAGRRAAGRPETGGVPRESAARGIPAGAAREAARGGAGTPPCSGEGGDGSRPGAGGIRRTARRGRGMRPGGMPGPGRPSSGVDGPAGIRALQGRSGGFARPGGGFRGSAAAGGLPHGMIGARPATAHRRRQEKGRAPEGRGTDRRTKRSGSA